MKDNRVWLVFQGELLFYVFEEREDAIAYVERVRQIESWLSVDMSPPTLYIGNSWRVAPKRFVAAGETIEP